MKKALLVLVLMLVAAVPAFANDGTITITEDDINAALSAVVDNAEQVDNLNVNLYGETAVMNATVTTQEGETVSVSVILTPVPQDDGEGFYWEVTGASVDGKTIPQPVIDDVNTTLATTELRQARTSAENNLLTDVTIDDASITYEVNEDVVEVIETIENVEPLTPDRDRPGNRENRGERGSRRP